MKNAETLLAFENVCAGYGRLRVLNGLTFEVNRGQVFGVIGPNGSGKTTMLNALTGLIRNTHGYILLDGKDISHLSVDARSKRGIGRTFQIPRPFVRMSVYENVLVSAVCGMGVSESAGREPVQDVLKATGLIEKQNLPSSSLPLLDRKKLEIARAIVARPRLLLLDEAAAGLTDTETQELILLVNKLKKAGFTILWIEHDIETMLQATDLLMCMAEGRSVLIGSPKRVMTSKEVERLYLGTRDEIRC